MASEAQDTPSAAQIEKRVVMYVVTGRRKGMRRIIGHMIYEAGTALPKSFKNVHVCEGEPGRDVHLVGEFPRYVLYSEIVPGVLKKPRAPRKAKVVGNDGRPAAS